MTSRFYVVFALSMAVATSAQAQMDSAFLNQFAATRFGGLFVDQHTYQAPNDFQLSGTPFVASNVASGSSALFNLGGTTFFASSMYTSAAASVTTAKSSIGLATDGVAAGHPFISTVSTSLISRFSVVSYQLPDNSPVTGRFLFEFDAPRFTFLNSRDVLDTGSYVGFAEYRATISSFGQVVGNCFTVTTCANSLFGSPLITVPGPVQLVQKHDGRMVYRFDRAASFVTGQSFFVNQNMTLNLALGFPQDEFDPAPKSFSVSVTNSHFAPISARMYVSSLTPGAQFVSPSGFNFSPVAQGVPEPANWVTLLCGFGMVGAAMRAGQSSRHIFKPMPG